MDCIKDDNVFFITKIFISIKEILVIKGGYRLNSIFEIWPDIIIKGAVTKEVVRIFIGGPACT